MIQSFALLVHLRSFQDVIILSRGELRLATCTSSYCQEFKFDKSLFCRTHANFNSKEVGKSVSNKPNVLPYHKLYIYLPNGLFIHSSRNRCCPFLTRLCSHQTYPMRRMPLLFQLLKHQKYIQDFCQVMQDVAFPCRI